MKSSFEFVVQIFTRKDWKSVFVSNDLDTACSDAKQRAVITRERVRVLRVDTTPIVSFNLYPYEF